LINPMVARLVRDPFDCEGWLFELKWDGFRAIAETDGCTADVEDTRLGKLVSSLSIETQVRVQSMQRSIGPYL